MECKYCGSSSDISNVSLEYEISKEEHYKDDPDSRIVLCEICLKELMRICTCDKQVGENPRIFCIDCNCKNFSSNCEPCTAYFNIKSIEPFLIDYNADYDLIGCCRGCKFSDKQIETDFNCASRAAITACVFKKDKGRLIYESDVLDPPFISYCNAKGLNIGTSVSI